MQYLLIAPALAFVYWLYIKIRALFLGNKAESQDKRLQEFKDEAIKQVNNANNSYEHTLELYKKYKAGKSDPDKS